MLVKRDGHLLRLDIAQPTKGLKVALRYDDCGISYVNTVDFMGSAHATRLTKSPADAPVRSVELAFDGWVFPPSGVAFVWVLGEGQPEHA